MSTFEYVATAYSVIFAAIALRLIGGLPHAFEKARRYWVHATLLTLLLLGLVQTFWNLLQYRDADWNLVHFFLILTIPGVLYFIASCAIPENPEAVSSWHDYYYAKRAKIYSGVLIWGVVAALNTTLLLGLPDVHAQRINQLGLVAIGAIGLSSARPSVHRTLVFVAAAVTVSSTVVILLRGGNAGP